MIVVTGRTYELRHFLGVVAGGRFSRERKRWEFDTMNNEHRERLKREPGVMVVEIEDEPPPARPMPIDAPSDYDGQTIFHGDDKSWLGYFRGSPIVHFGFSSLRSLTDYIDGLPSHIQTDMRRNDGWREDFGDWSGTPSMKAAIKLANEGWPRGIDLAEMILEHLIGHNAIERRRKYSVAGGTVNIGRLLSGNPLHMLHRSKQPGKKIITFFSEVGFNSYIKKGDAALRAAIIGAMTDVLEANGFRCEIVAVDTTYDRRRIACYIAVNLKQAGEPLNLNDLVFGLGHPSMVRRLCFATVASDSALHGIWDTMGKAGDAFDEDHPTAPNEIYIKRLADNVEAETDLERAFKIWDMITEGVTLPIEIKRG